MQREIANRLRAQYADKRDSREVAKRHSGDSINAPVSCAQSLSKGINTLDEMRAELPTGIVRSLMRRTRDEKARPPIRRTRR